MRKFFCLLLILLMFMSKCNVPVYAEDNESYTLEPGKVYRFQKFSGENLEAEFSDYVLWSDQYNGYGTVNYYDYGNYANNSKSYTNVYNSNNESVTMTITGGEIRGVTVYDSPFSLVMYDATETEFKIINNIDDYITCKQVVYDESDHSFDAKPDIIRIEGSRTLTGAGFLLFRSDDKFNNTTFQGVYEVTNYVRSDFFQAPPWILRMDLAGMTRVLLDQLSMLLPVALVILSVFLLISLLLYTIHLLL